MLGLSENAERTRDAVLPARADLCADLLELICFLAQRSIWTVAPSITHGGTLQPLGTDLVQLCELRLELAFQLLSARLRSCRGTGEVLHQNHLLWMHGSPCLLASRFFWCVLRIELIVK